ncbi:MAG TPA: VOC family protein [Chloroflexota bacterium]
MLKGVHHIAYVVADMDRMVEMMDRVFGMKPQRRLEVPQSAQEVALFEMEGGATLEVIRPLNDHCIWAEFLRMHGGDGIHHIGYAVDGIDARLSELEANGIKLIDQRSKVSGVGWTVGSVDPESTIGLWFQLVQP